MKWSKSTAGSPKIWCVQYIRPSGLSALNKHQNQDKWFDLSHFPSKSKYKLHNLTNLDRNKIICFHFIYRRANQSGCINLCTLALSAKTSATLVDSQVVRIKFIHIFTCLSNLSTLFLVYSISCLRSSVDRESDELDLISENKKKKQVQWRNIGGNPYGAQLLYLRIFS